MLEELLQSTRASLTERLTSPLLGTFLLSWVIWNWKFLVILFSDASVLTTFALTQTHSFPDAQAILLRGLLLPAITALAFILLYPYPYRWVLEYTLQQQRRTAAVRLKVEDETPLTLADSRRLRAEIVNMDRKSRETVASLNEEIARLNAALELNRRTGESSTDTPEGQDEEPNDPLSMIELQVLNAIDKSGGRALQGDILPRLDATRIEKEFAVGELERRELIHKGRNLAGGSPMITFTHKGRKALLDSKNQAKAS
jgi:hypothetical protein